MNQPNVDDCSVSPSSTPAPRRTVSKALLSNFAGLFIAALDGDTALLRPTAADTGQRISLSARCRFPKSSEVQFTLNLDNCAPMQFSIGSTHARADLLDLRRLLNSGPNSISESRRERVEEVRTKLEAAVCSCSSFQRRVAKLTW